MKDIKSFEGLLRAAATKEAFLATCRSFETPDVMIDYGALASFAAAVNKPKFISGWDEYRTPGNDLPTDFVELAVSTVQQGGYLYADARGRVRKWEIGGSGAKALLSKMDEARNAQSLPAIHINTQAEAEKSLRTIFNGTPYSHQRTKIWQELAATGKAEKLKEILQQSQTADGGYRFEFSTLKSLANVLPQGLGEDPFLKKVALLTILFAGVAHHKLAPNSVKLDVIVPADYRVPQTGHNAGLLRFSDRLVATLDSGALLSQSDFFVTQIRSKTVEMFADLLECVPADKDIRLEDMDGEFWFAGRLFDSDPAALDEKKAAMRKAFELHGHASGFNVRGFRKKASQPMNVESLRF